MADPQAQTRREDFVEFVLPGAGVGIIRAWLVFFAVTAIADTAFLWAVAALWLLIAVVESFAWMVRP